MNPDARRRVLAASLALSTYAAAGCTPAEAPEPFNATHETDKLDYPAPRSIETADAYRVEQARPPRARVGRSRARGGEGRSPQASGDVRTVSSTAYCLTGIMANGQRVHAGAVAMNGVPMGSVWQVDGGGTYTVADRIGHSSGFDIWMPSCAAAIQYGRRTITVRRIA